VNLKQVYMLREDFGPSKGQLKGFLTFENSLGEIKLTITPEQAERFIALFADALVESAKEIAQNLTSQLLINENNLLT
jgi:hypothetical protein